jgi:photoactive yellow protein
MSNVMTMNAGALERLEAALDEAVADRNRVNRRIRMLRDAMDALRAGDSVPGLTELLGAAQAGRSALARPTLVSPEPRAPEPAAWGAPAPGEGPAVAGFGPGLPPGVMSPTPPPPAPALNATSVDVSAIGAMTPEQLDGLPFGVVTLDSSGRVVGYNDTESRLAGLPKERVIGRNFFTEVAPCTRVREFEGRFREFAEGRSRVALETFDFVFNFRHGAQRVMILISPARHRGRFHVSMIRR